MEKITTQKSWGEVALLGRSGSHVWIQKEDKLTVMSGEETEWS